MIDIGRLDQRIELLIPTETTAPVGGVDLQWGSLRVVWAAPMEGLSRDFVSATGVVEQGRTAFLVRWASDIEAAGPSLRVRWRGRLFECIGMTGSCRKGELRLQCKDIGSDAG